MNNQKETPGKSYLCYKNTEKYLCFLVTTQVGLSYFPMHNFPRCNQRE